MTNNLQQINRLEQEADRLIDRIMVLQEGIKSTLWIMTCENKIWFEQYKDCKMTKSIEERVQEQQVFLNSINNLQGKIDALYELREEIEKEIESLER